MGGRLSPKAASPQAHFERGLAFGDAGQWAQAAQAYTEALALDPQRRGPRLNRAQAWAALQCWPQALADLKTVLTQAPSDVSALTLMGQVQLQSGDVQAAAQTLQLAYQTAPDDADLAHQALACSLLMAGHESAALQLALRLAQRGHLTHELARSTLQVLSLADDAAAGIDHFWQSLQLLHSPASWMHEGLVGHLLGQGRYDEATVQCMAWLQAEPDSAKAADCLAQLLASRGDHHSAVRLMLSAVRRGGASEPLDRMIRLVRVLAESGQHLTLAGVVCNTLVQDHPQEPRVWALRGRLLLQLFESEAAEADLRKALELESDPASVSALCDHSLALGQLGRASEALALLDQQWTRLVHLEALEPINARANLLRRLGRLDEAEDWLRLGLRDRHHPVLAKNLAFILLLKGQYPEGLALLADRDYCGSPQGAFLQARAQGMQAWSGDRAQLRGAHLLLVSQNGIGDTVQFARFAPMLIQDGARVTLQAPLGMAELMRSLHPQLQVIEVGEPFPTAQWVADVYSLPALLGVTLDNVAAAAPAQCLKADPMRVQALRLSLGPRRGLRIGLCWRGTRSNLAQRSIPLSEVVRWAIPGVEWYSLQHGPLQDDELEPARRLGLHHASWSFPDAAAAMTLMDLVVSVDTVHAHLSGSLGLKTLVPLSAVPDWRWGTQGSSTPWYPSLELFRQVREGRWDEPLSAVAEALLCLQRAAPAEEPILRLADARRWLRQVGGPQSAAPELWMKSLVMQGRLEEALLVGLRTLTKTRQEAELTVLAGRCLAVASELDQASGLMRLQALLIERAPGSPAAQGALLTLSERCAHRGLLELALASALAATQAAPQSADAQAALGRRLLDQHQLDAAVPPLMRALQLQPNHAQAECGWLQLLALRHEYETVLARSTALLQTPVGEPLGPQVLAWMQLRTLALEALGQYEAAELCARQACARVPDSTRRVALGLQRLAAGDWAEGWALWRTRDRAADHAPHTRRAIAAGARLWTEPGVEQLRGQRLLVTSENGHGDTFQFGRFLPWLADQGVQVTLLARPEAYPLLACASQGVHVLLEGGPEVQTARFDAVCDAQWLPALLDVRPETLQQITPATWLKLPANGRARSAIPVRSPARPRVGLAWRGQALGPVIRSLPLSLVANAGFSTVDWISLQGDGLRDEERPAASSLQLFHPAWSFADTAAAMLDLDLVISVDTSIAHLAGALGVACAVVLPQPADWRWGRQGNTTVWYPKARLFRQPSPGDWAGALSALKSAYTFL